MGFGGFKNQISMIFLVLNPFLPGSVPVPIVLIGSESVSKFGLDPGP